MRNYVRVLLELTPWNSKCLSCSWTVVHPKLCKSIPPHRQRNQRKTTKRLAALVTISRILPTVAGGGSTAKLQQPPALLLILSSQSSLIRPGDLPAGGTLVAANPQILPLATLPSSKNRRQPNLSHHHSEGDFNVHKINVISLYLPISRRKFLLAEIPSYCNLICSAFYLQVQ
jgi:hypothetical protein